MAILELQNLSKSFGKHSVLQDVSLHVDDGEFLVLVGPSGCGKSTLLRLVAGLEAQNGGTIRIGERVVDELEPRERDVAMVFQNYALYPHMSVRKNLAFPLELAKRGSRAEITLRVEEAAAMLGITELLDRKPATLSGGQMQRVALGRAIVRRPAVFLFDEPLSNLDAELRVAMRREIVRLHGKLRVTSLYVTHDQVEAMTMGQRICVLDGGRIQQVGTPRELYDRPANAFVARFLGSPPMNVFPATCEGGRIRLNGVELVPARGELPHEILIGVRPQEVMEGGPIEVEVLQTEDLGDQKLFVCHDGEREWIVATRGNPLEPRTRIGVTPPAVHVFDREGSRRLV